MRRQLVFVLLLLALGASSSILSAWLLASMRSVQVLRLDVWWRSSATWIDGPWIMNQWSGPGQRMRVMGPRAAMRPLFLPEERDLRAWREGLLPGGWENRLEFPTSTFQPSFVEHARGWPWLSMRCVWRFDARPDARFGPVLTGGLPIKTFIIEWQGAARMSGTSGAEFDFDLAESAQALPLLPMWPGLIASSLAYAAAWGLVVFVLSLPAALRRWWRRRKQRCLRCGYHVRHGHSHACSECGRAVAARWPWITRGKCALALLLLIGVVMANGWLAAIVVALHDEASPAGSQQPPPPPGIVLPQR